MPSDLIRGPAPDLIRGGDRFASRKRVKSIIWSPVWILSKRKRLRRLPLVGTSPPAVVRFKYDNRGAGLSVPSGAKERVPDASENEDGKAEADDRQRKHCRAGFGPTRLCGPFENL